MDFTTVNGLSVLSTTPVNDGGQALNTNFLSIGSALTLTLKYQGAWSSAKTYNLNDVVTVGGVCYFATAASTNHTPPNTSYWSALGTSGSTPTLDQVLAAGHISTRSLEVGSLTADYGDVTINSGGVHATSSSQLAYLSLTGDLAMDTNVITGQGGATIAINDNSGENPPTVIIDHDESTEESARLQVNGDIFANDLTVNDVSTQTLEIQSYLLFPDGTSVGNGAPAQFNSGLYFGDGSYQSTAYTGGGGGGSGDYYLEGGTLYLGSDTSQAVITSDGSGGIEFNGPLEPIAQLDENGDFNCNGNITCNGTVNGMTLPFALPEIALQGDVTGDIYLGGYNLWVSNESGSVTGNIYLLSPNGTIYALQVDNDGNLSALGVGH